MKASNEGRVQTEVRVSHQGPVLRPAEAAKYVGISKGSLAKYRCKTSSGPRFIKLGARVVVYEKTELDRWLASHGTRRSTSDTSPAA